MSKVEIGTITTLHDEATNVLVKSMYLEEGVMLKAVRNHVGELWTVSLVEDGVEGNILCAKPGREIMHIFLFVQDCVNADLFSREMYEGSFSSLMWLALCFRHITNFRSERFECLAGFIYMWAKEEGDEKLCRAILEASAGDQ